MQAMSALATVISCADAASKDMCDVADKLSETQEDLREVKRELSALERREVAFQQSLKDLKETEQRERMQHQVKMLELRSRLTTLLTSKSAAAQERDELHRIDVAQWRPRREVIDKLRSLLEQAMTRNKRLVRLMNSD
jgi:DNA repair exonuclease SbcCD ATPase subunit